MNTVTNKPKYLMNVETREIFPYTEALETMKEPKFLPFVGKLPPPDLDRGVPIAPTHPEGEEPAPPTSEERIRIIAGVLPIIPKEERTSKGEYAQLAVEKASGLEKVTRQEITLATGMRMEVLRAKSDPPEVVDPEIPAEMAPAEETE